MWCLVKLVITHNESNYSKSDHSYSLQSCPWHVVIFGTSILSFSSSLLFVNHFSLFYLLLDWFCNLGAMWLRSSVWLSNAYCWCLSGQRISSLDHQTDTETVFLFNHTHHSIHSRSHHSSIVDSSLTDHTNAHRMNHKSVCCDIWMVHISSRFHTAFRLIAIRFMPN